MNKRAFTVVLIVAILLSVLPIAFYYYKFPEPSNNQVHWVNFSNFLNVFVSISSLLIVSSLTYFLYHRQSENERLATIPILIFKINANTHKWVMQNVGKGVALNILVTYSYVMDDWLKPVKVYSLIENSEIEISWVQEPLQIIAVYFDYLGNYYISTCQNDDTQIVFDSFKNPLEKFKNDYFRLEEKVNLIPRIRGLS